MKKINIYLKISSATWGQVKTRPQLNAKVGPKITHYCSNLPLAVELLALSWLDCAQTVTSGHGIHFSQVNAARSQTGAQFDPSGVQFDDGWCMEYEGDLQQLIERAGKRWGRRTERNC